jgi:hypothetical protein
MNNGGFMLKFLIPQLYASTRGSEDKSFNFSTAIKNEF